MMLISKAIESIENYFKKCKPEHPVYHTTRNNGLMFAEINYDKGFHRASCFKDLLLHRDCPMKLKFFFLYTLLNEKNGKNLRSCVHSALIANFGQNYLIKVEKYILHEYKISPEDLSKWQAELLSIIHNQKNDHSYSRKDNFTGSWQSNELMQLIAGLEIRFLSENSDNDFILTKGNELIAKAIESIESYFQKYKPEHPVYHAIQNNGLMFTEINYDKGFHRASCFKDLLLHKDYPMKLKLFFIYTLLNEINGKNLRSCVHNELIANFGQPYLIKIQKFILHEYKISSEDLLKRQAELLSIIHNPNNDHSYSRKDDFTGSWQFNELTQLITGLENHLLGSLAKTSHGVKC